MVNAFHHPSKCALPQSADNFIWEGGETEIKKKKKRQKRKDVNDVNKKVNKQENRR